MVRSMPPGTRLDLTLPDPSSKADQRLWRVQECELKGVGSCRIEAILQLVRLTEIHKINIHSVDLRAAEPHA